MNSNLIFASLFSIEFGMCFVCFIKAIEAKMMSWALLFSIFLLMLPFAIYNDLMKVIQ